MVPTKYDLPLTGLGYLEWYHPHKVFHPGIDLNCGYGNQDCGQEVVAAKSGQVIYVHENVATSGGFGKFIIIKHDDGFYTRSAHLQDILVANMQEVKEGDLIALIGNTGTTYCHLHFEVFGKSIAEIQRNHWRPWRFYPSNKPKAWVSQRYIDPFIYCLKEEERTDLNLAYEWAVQKKIIRSSKPKDVVTVDMICLMLERFKDLK